MTAEHDAHVPDAHLARVRQPQFRRMLLEQRAGLLGRLGGGGEDARVVADRSVSDAAFVRATAYLEEVDAALQRFDAGTYGSCVSCGQAIPIERLEVVPAATRCVRCQTRAASLLS
jgi:DnaK suppressor protein